MSRDNSSNRPRVQIGASVARDSNLSSPNTSVLNSRATFGDVYGALLANALANRAQHKVVEGTGENAEDLTPLLLDEDDGMKKKVKRLTNYARQKENDFTAQAVVQENSSSKSSSKTSLGSLTFSIGGYPMQQEIDDEFDEQAELDDDALANDGKPVQQVPPFIKIVLKRSPEMVFFENRCLTVPRGTDQSQKVEDDNKFYDYITTGKGRIRRTNTSETQTTDLLLKSRETNTPQVNINTIESYVSNFDMFSTFRDVDSVTSQIKLDNSNSMNITTYKPAGEDQTQDIFESSKFKLATMVTLRILAGNVFQEEQLRFRNTNMKNALTTSCEFKYSLKLLFRFNPQASDRVRKSVADLSFCPGNGDILAVAYGIYSFEAMHVPDSGYCCVWNIKNPVNPERLFLFNVPVVSVRFSPFLPQLLAIGLYDGRVEVRDISTFAEQPVASSLRIETSTCDPITAIEWIPAVSFSGVDKNEIDPLLALSEDGGVTKYRIINSPYLLAFKQIQLENVEGTPEGLPIKRDWELDQANRNPQGLNMALHPRQDDIYYVLTDEGCIHKASTNYPHQHLEVLQVHSGSVNVMDFSPWSSKLFLTAGNDWCIRIWMDGMLTPLITLKHEIGPIHCAAWSKTHSTIIVANTRDSIHIWDIRRSTLRPVSSATVDKSHYTLFRFSQCGRSMAIGNERGQVLMLAFEDMPFPPHFQYEELELSLYKAVSTDSKLTTELKSFGYFGYPEHRPSRKQHCSV